jgi:hypothetical protein
MARRLWEFWFKGGATGRAGSFCPCPHIGRTTAKILPLSCRRNLFASNGLQEFLRVTVEAGEETCTGWIRLLSIEKSLRAPVHVLLNSQLHGNNQRAPFCFGLMCKMNREPGKGN